MLKNRFSTAITVLRTNRTQSNDYPEIGRLKPKSLSAVDEKIKKFFPFSPEI